MKIKFCNGLINEAVAMAAVTADGEALQYVKDQNIFIKVANFFNIDIEF